MSTTVVKFKIGRRVSNPAMLEINTWASERIGLQDWAWHYWNKRTKLWVSGIEFVNQEDAVAFKLSHPALITYE
jgi:hypothetical protein